MTQPQHALAPIVPVKGDIEVDAAFTAGETYLLFDPALGGLNAGMRDYVAAFERLNPGLAPFQIGNFVFAGRLEHAIARVPVGLQRDFLKGAMRQSSDHGLFVAFK